MAICFIEHEEAVLLDQPRSKFENRLNNGEPVAVPRDNTSHVNSLTIVQVAKIKLNIIPTVAISTITAMPVTFARSHIIATRRWGDCVARWQCGGWNIHISSRWCTHDT